MKQQRMEAEKVFTGQYMPHTVYVLCCCEKCVSHRKRTAAQKRYDKVVRGGRQKEKTKREWVQKEKWRRLKERGAEEGRKHWSHRYNQDIMSFSGNENCKSLTRQKEEDTTKEKEWVRLLLKASPFTASVHYFVFNMHCLILCALVLHSTPRFHLN